MKIFTKVIAVIVTGIAPLYVALIFPVPANAQNLANNATTTLPATSLSSGESDLISQWMVLAGLFGSQATSTASSLNGKDKAISQWIALNWLFGNGNNFNNLDQISKWIILNGLFGGQIPANK